MFSLPPRTRRWLVTDFLEEMADESSRRAGLARERSADLEIRAKQSPPPVVLDLSAPGFDVIAEVKVASPSEGNLVSGLPDAATLVKLAAAYDQGGAAAISVLTETISFQGSMGDLEAVSAASSLPVMRKDFLVDPIQVLEARAGGASGVLLIARMLPGELLEEMTDLTLDFGMFVLVEVFDRSDLESAARVFDREVLVGVNARDLSSLEVDLSRFESLAPHLPDHLPAVAESGLSTGDDVATVAGLGYRMALVGSSLVRSTDPVSALEAMLGAGRGRLEEEDS
jgi:indole-3-glycerol phosphate synthase